MDYKWISAFCFKTMAMKLLLSHRNLCSSQTEPRALKIHVPNLKQVVSFSPRTMATTIISTAGDHASIFRHTHVPNCWLHVPLMSHQFEFSMYISAYFSTFPKKHVGSSIKCVVLLTVYTSILQPHIGYMVIHMSFNHPQQFKKSTKNEITITEVSLAPGWLPRW